jgi:membrane-associated phospholipid phosphatase
MKSLFKQNAVFLTLSLLLALSLGLALIYIPKGELHLLLCDRHTHARDIFYRYYTTLAEWLPYVICVALLLFTKIGHGVFASTAMLLSTLLTQVCKHIVNAPRPVTWFTEHFQDIQLPLVDGVHMNLWYSFPSGHTTSFFAMTLAVCILITKNLSAKRSYSTSGHTAERSYSVSGHTEERSYSVSGHTAKRSYSDSGLTAIAVQLLLFIAATLGAYSRIYLSQHFAMDVFAGLLVGILSTLAAYAIFYHFQDKKWYNYRLFQKK